MTDTRLYVRGETLGNGVGITIRAVRPDDRDRNAKAFRLSSVNRCRRVPSAFRGEPSEAELDDIAALDFDSAVMLVATIGGPDGEIVIGGGRYVAGTGGGGKHEAEVAFTVEGDYQGLGIASRLLCPLYKADLSNGPRQINFASPGAIGQERSISRFAESGRVARHRWRLINAYGAVRSCLVVGRPFARCPA